MFEENCLQHIIMCLKKTTNHSKEMLFTPHVTTPQGYTNRHVCSLPTTFDVNNDLIYCSNMCYTYWYMLVSL